MNTVNLINFDYFTTELRELVFAVERRNTEAYPIIVSGMMTSMATAMQDLIQVKMPNGVVNPVSLAIGVIGESGDRKTSVLNLLLKPIIQFDEIAEQDLCNQLLEYKNEKKFFNRKENAIQAEIIKSIKKGKDDKELEDRLKSLHKQAPKEPLSHVRCRSNTTIPALMRNMSKSAVGQLFVTTEAGGAINKWSMEEIGSLIGLLDGESIKVDRVSTESYVIKNKRLSCAFSLQPQLYDDILSRKGNVLMESGLIPRMLISRPVSLQGHRNRSIPTHSPFIGGFYERIEELLQQAKRKDISKPLIEMYFDFEAERLWFDVAQRLESSIASNGHNRDVSKWVNRTLDNVSRMAALIEYYTHGVEGKDRLPIRIDSLNMAMSLGDFWLNEAKMLFGDWSGPHKQAALAKKLLEYFVRKIRLLTLRASAFFMTKKEIYSNGPRELRSSEVSQNVIDYLINQGFLEYRYYANPEPEKNPNAPPQLAGYGLTLQCAQMYGLMY